MKLQGIYAPTATPFDHNGEMYKIKVQHNIEKWNRTGLSGYVVCGSTGEAVYLSTEERIQQFAWYAEFSDPEKTLIAGTGLEGARETIKLTNKAAELGYKAALVLTPNYFTSLMARPESQLLFFRTVADQSKIPVLLYNYPQVSGIALDAETVGTARPAHLVWRHGGNERRRGAHGLARLGLRANESRAAESGVMMLSCPAQAGHPVVTNAAVNPRRP